MTPPKSRNVKKSVELQMVRCKLVPGVTGEQRDHFISKVYEIVIWIYSECHLCAQNKCTLWDWNSDWTTRPLQLGEIRLLMTVQGSSSWPVTFDLNAISNVDFAEGKVTTTTSSDAPLSYSIWKLIRLLFISCTSISQDTTETCVCATIVFPQSDKMSDVRWSRKV